jgi:hypothetical protein
VTTDELVLYVSCYTACGHAGEVHLEDDTFARDGVRTAGVTKGSVLRKAGPLSPAPTQVMNSLTLSCLNQAMVVAPAESAACAGA